MSLLPVLPDDTQLDIWQKNIVNLCASNCNQDWIIQGGPGTGKTLTSIALASELRSQKHGVLLLIFNKPIQQYLEYALSRAAYNCHVQTYIQWLSDYYRDVFRRQGYPSNGPFNPVWSIIENDFSNRATLTYPTVIIDECQDVPVELLKCLKHISGNIICFWDPAQALQPDKTKLVDLLNVLQSPKILTFGTNFRNTKEIRSVADFFVNNANHPTAQAISSGKKPVMWNCQGNYSFMDDLMVSVIKQNPSKSIGVICPSSDKNWLIQGLYNELSIRLNGVRTVEMHLPRGKSLVNFASKSVKLFTYNTMKGLEFDIVLIPRIDQIYSSKNAKIDRTRLYVAITRANEELHCFYLRRNVQNTQKWIDTMSIINGNSRLFDWK